MSIKGERSTLALSFYNTIQFLLGKVLVRKMSSKTFIFLVLSMAIVLLINSEVAGRELAASTSTTPKEKTEGVAAVETDQIGPQPYGQNPYPYFPPGEAMEKATEAKPHN